MPSRTASSALLHKKAIASSMPAPPVSGRPRSRPSVIDLKCDSAISEMARIFSRLALVRIG